MENPESKEPENEKNIKLKDKVYKTHFIIKQK